MSATTMWHRLAFTALAQSVAATAVGASDAPFVDCVDTLQPAKSLGAAAKAIVDARDVGDVTVMQFDGNYDRGVAAPRQAVAQRFLQDHVDAYDFLIVFTTFEFETGTAQAFYNTIKNDVAGIGDMLYDHSSAFGSAGRLQGYVDMAATTRYAFDPRDARYEHALNTLAHELMHRWGAGVQYRDAGGDMSDALIGRAGRHWSYFLDSDASVMYGSDWQRRPDGRYEAVAVRARYSPLDLYVAGFAAASEVPPLTLLRGGDGNVEDTPRLGAITGGTPETVTIEQIVAASGARTPTAADAPKNFRAALIVLTRPGEEVSPQVLFGLESLRKRFQQRFAQMTDSRAMLRIFAERKLAHGPSLPTILTGSGDTTTVPGNAAAVAWLEGRQATDGHWHDRPATAMRDTVAALRALETLAPQSPAITRARTWIAARTVASNDARAWQYLATGDAAQRDALAAAQGADGGWGLAAGLQASPFDTAIVGDLVARHAPESAAVDGALQHLVPQQNADGSFGATAGGRGRLLPTLHATRLLHASAQAPHRDAAARAGAWLDTRRLGNGYGQALQASLADTIELYSLVGELPLAPDGVTGARAFVRERQQIAGDWGGSVYLTATALLASARDQRVNFTTVGAIVATPSAPTDGTQVALAATVTNAGNVAAPASVARWYDGDPDQGGVQIGSDVAVPVLVAGARHPVQVVWDTTGRAGTHAINLVLDADQAVAELREDDNRATLALTVGAAPTQADLQLLATELALDPAAVAELPATIRARGIVRNLGLTAAAGVRITVHAASAPTTILAETTLDVPARGSTPLDLAFTVANADALAIVLRADPDNAIAEAREDNNEARLALAFGPSIDLAVAPGDLAIDGAAVAGRDVALRVDVHNRGTLATPPAVLRVEVVQNGTTHTVLDTTVQIAAGATTRRQLAWRPPAPGTAQLRVMLDPAGQIAEAREDNNAAQLDFTVGSAERPDLAAVAATLEFTPTPALQGQPLLASLRVRNDGADVVAPFAVGLYAGDPRVGAPRIGGAVVAGLAAGADTVVAINVTELELSGTPSLFIAVDDGNAVDELDEANNVAIRTVSILSLPDVAISVAGIALTPMLPVGGEAVAARVTVRNLGGQDAHDVTLRLFEGDGSTGSVALGDRTVALLPAGGSAELVWTWTLGAQARAVTAVADPDDTVREPTNDNNRATLPFDVQNGTLFASERYVSPNGDGVRDETALVFRAEGAGPVKVRIASGLGFVARQFVDIAVSGGRGQVVWDGRDDRGRIVPDGDYRVVVADAGGRVFGETRVTVDNNLSSVLEAIGTPHAITTDVGLYEPRIPPAGAPNATDLYGIVEETLPTGVRRGIYRANALATQPSPVVSLGWATRHGNVVDFVFSPDGSEVAFTYVGLDGRRRALRASALSVDATLPVQPAGDTVERSVGGYFDASELLLLRATGNGTDIADLRTQQIRPFRELPDAYLKRDVTSLGVLLSSSDAEHVYYFVPRDTARPVIELEPMAGEPGTRYVTVVSPDGTRVLLHMRTPDRETLTHVDLATGARRVLVDRANDVSASPHFRDEPGGIGSVRELAFEWIARLDQIVVVDGRARRLLRFDGNGAPLDSLDLPAVGRVGPYRLDPQSDLFAHAFATTSSLHPDDTCLDVPATVGGQRRLYDPTTESIFVHLKEVVGTRHYAGSEDYAAYLDGIAQFVSAGLETREVMVVGAGSFLPLDLPADSARYPLLAPECSASRPSTWPELILRDGARLLADGRVLSVSRGISAQPWASAGTVKAVWPDENHLLTATTTVTSLLNGSAAIASRLVGRSFALSGVAADRNFAYYEIDYARADAPTQWHALVLPQADEVLYDEFLTWAPPEPGVYTVRLRVVDRAGNATTATTSVAATDRSGIDGFGLSPRYVSPNGDGVQDDVDVRFRVRVPVSLQLVVANESGAVVRTQERSYGAGDLGVQALAWDGRNDAGVVVPDGRYRVAIGGFAAWVVVDTVAPLVEATLDDAYRMAPLQPGELRPGVLGTLPLLRLEASDANAVRATLEAVAQADGATSTLAADVTASRSLHYVPWTLYATSSFRIVAIDAAGNRVLHTVVQGPQRLPLFAFGAGAASDEPLAIPYEQLPSDESAGLLMRPAIVDEDGRVALRALPAMARLQNVGVQARLVDGAPGAWTEVAFGAPVYAECRPGVTCASDRPSEWIETTFGVQGMARGKTYDVRLVGERDDGSRVLSNRAAIRLGGLGDIECHGNEIQIPEYNAGTLRSATLFYTDLDTPGVPPGSVDAAQIDPAKALFRFMPPNPGAEYRFRVEAVDASGGRHVSAEKTCVSVDDGVSGPSPAGYFSIAVAPVVQDQCTGDPSGLLRATAKIAQNGGAGAAGAPIPLQLRWRYTDGETLRETTGDPIELGSGNPYAFRSTLELAVANWPEGSYAIALDGGYAAPGGGIAWQPIVTRRVPVEKLPPRIAIHTPVDGERVCTTDLLRGMRASLVTPTTMTYRVSVGQGAAPPSWQCIRERGAGMGDTDRCIDYAELERLDGTSVVNGNVLGDRRQLNQPEPLVGALKPYNGAASIRLSAVNYSGGSVCSTATVHLDSDVEFVERAAPTQTVMSAGEPLIVVAPGAHARARLRLRADEPVSIAVKLFRVTDFLGTVQSRTGAEGDIDIEWAGDVDGATVADGMYRLDVVATDDCGQTTTIAYRVLVKSAPPSVAFTAPAPGSLITPAVVNVFGTVDDLWLDRWTVEVATAAAPDASVPVASGTTTMPLRDGIAPQLAAWSRGQQTGAVTFRLRAADRFGNTATAELPLVLDAPATLIAAASVAPSLFSPNGDGVLDATRVELALQRAANVAIRARNAAGADVVTVYDGAAATGVRGYPWDGRAGAVVLPDGDYTLAIDVADGATATEHVQLAATIDTTAPVLALTAPTSGYIRPQQTLRFTAQDRHLVAVEASLSRGGAVVVRSDSTNAGESTLVVPPDAVEGAYVLRLAARDGAGNRSEKLVDVVLDRTLPVVTLTAPVEGAIVPATTPTSVRGSATDANFATYTLSAASASADDWQTLATGTTPLDAAEILAWTPQRPDGAYRLRLVAEDRAGNVGEIVRTVTVDGTPPVATIAQPSEGAYVQRAFDVVGTATDAHFAEYCLAAIRASALPGGTWSDVHVGTAPVDASTLAALNLGLPDDEYVVRLTVRDRAGLTATDEVRVRLDAVPPPAPLSLTGRVEDNRHALLAWSPVAAADLAGYHVYRGGVRITTTPVAPAQYADRDAPEGTQRYTVTAVDHAGNASAPSNAVALSIDHTAPAARLLRPADGERVRGTVDIVGTAWSRDDFREYRVTVEPLQPPGAPVELRRSPLPVEAGTLASWNTTVHADETRVRLRLDAEDRSGNVAVALAEVTVDNLAPAAPTGVVASLATASGAPCTELGGSARDVRVCWNANPEIDLLGYLVYRNGVLLDAPRVPPADLRPYAIPDPARRDIDVADGVHTYVVYAIDRAGNISAPSDPAELAPIENGPPDLAIEQPLPNAVFDRSLAIHATSAHRDVASVQFAYRRAGDSSWTDMGTALTAEPYRVTWTPGALPLGDYDIRGTASDTTGNIDPTPPVVRVTYADLTSPDAPTALTARADGDTVTLAWTASASSDVVGYELSRYNGQWWETLDGMPTAATTHVDAGRDDGEWRYRVIAIDTYGNRSATSNDAVAPVFGLALIQPYSPTMAGTVDVVGRSARPGTLAIRIENAQGGNELTPVALDAQGTIALSALALQPGENRLVLHVTDAQGHRSRAADVWITRGTAPAVPTGLAANVAGHDVTVSWNANAEPDVIGYRVFRRDSATPADAALDATLSATSVGGYAPEAAIDSDPLTAWEATHEYGTEIENDRDDPQLELAWASPRLVVAANLTWLSASQAAGNVDLQGWSGRAWITLARVRGDALSTSSIVPATPYRTDRVRLVVRGPGRAGVFDYRLAEITLVERPLLDATTLTDTLIDGRYDYRVSAVNALGFESERSSPVVADVGDTEAPDAVVLSGSVVGNAAQLSWTASAAPDVARYELQRNGTRIATLAASAPRTWTDAGLANGTYAYTVVAFDGFDNASPPSNMVTLTVADGGPGVPQNLRVVAPREGAALDLAWDAGAGNAAATYVVRRAPTSAGPFVEIARVAAPTYRNAPLVNGTIVWYTVEAIDAAGNASGPSTPVAGTPRDGMAPTSPRLSYPTVTGIPLATMASSTLVCGIAEPGSHVAVERDGVAVAEIAARTTLAESSLTIGASGNVRVLPAPDGRHYALESLAGTVSYADVDGGGAVVSTTAANARWARHGLALYYADLASGAIVRTEPGREPVAYGIAVADLRAFAISADERRILVAGSIAASGTPQAGVWIANVDGTQARRIDGIDAADVWGSALEFSPDGRHALVGTFASQLFVVDTQSARVLATHAIDVAAASAWSPDGRYAYVVRNANGNSDVYVASIGDAVSRLVSSDPVSIGLLSWSPDGNQLLVAASDYLDVRDAADGRSTIGSPLPDLGSTVAVWTASGRIVAKAEFGPLRLIDPAGIFCAGPLDLVAPRHVFSAVARDAAGNTSLPAASIDVLRDAATLPDLAIGATDILVVPADVRPGDTASVLVTLRNTGEARAAQSTMRATLAAPDGTTRTLATAPVPPLDSGAAYAMRIDLGMLDAAGTWHLTVVLDAPAQIAESNEANNRAEALIAVVGDTPVLDVHADRALYAPGETIGGAVSVAGVAQAARVRVTVIDAAGVVVDEVGDFTVGPLARGERWTQPVQWPADGVLAGDYRLRARLVAAGGALLAERVASVTIAAVQRVTLRVEPDASLVAAGTTVHVRSTVEYTDGNAPIEGARLRLVAVAPDGAERVVADQALGTLLPGYALHKDDAWNTAGLAAGTYGLQLRLTAPGLDRRIETSVTIDDPGTRIVLAGTLALVPSDALVAGPGGELRSTLANRGDTLLTGIDARVRVTAAGSPTVVAQAERHIDLAPGASDEALLALAAPPLTLVAHTAVLEARLPGDPAGQWRLLARRSFGVVDAVEPEIVVLTPPSDVVQPAVVPLRASIVDRHSSIAAVQFRIDSGSWQPISVGADGVYTRGVAGLADGMHSVVVRARDAWGNETTSPARTFTVDATPPAITIAGVADGDVVNHTFAPTIAIVEATPGATDIRLNGVPYVSATTIDTDGDYVLSVRATDQAGNTSLRSVRFAIDRSVPPVTIVSPADGSVVAQSAVTVVVRTEANANVTLSVGASQAQVVADASGDATFLAVPLALGDNTLDARARDRAGNLGGPVTALVRYEPVPVEGFVGSLQPEVNALPHGQPLTVSIAAENTGNQPLPAQRLRVRVAGAAPLAETILTHDFAAGGTYATVLDYATGDWPLGSVTVTLERERGAAWIALDSKTVEIVDRTLPTLDAVAPVAGAVLRAPVTVRATASDALTGVAAVEARVDGAVWIALAAASTPGEYASTPQKLVDGDHAAELRATDGAGNVRSVAAIPFAVDTLAPTIAITGVADGDLVAQPVTPIITVTDAHPASQTITLNGAAYALGTPITASGDYLLVVDATDRAGNHAEASVAFVIDREAPVVAITSPVDGVTVDTPTITIAGTTEPLAAVDVDVGTFSARVFADAGGAFSVAGATLQVGSNAIRAQATDRAGNVGGATTIHVTYAPAAQGLLTGALDLLPPYVVRGTPLRITHSLQNPGTTAASNVPVRVVLRAGGNDVDADAFTVTLAPQASQNGSSDFDTSALVPGAYDVVLEAWQAASGGTPTWRVLDDGTIDVFVSCGAPRGVPGDRLFADGFDGSVDLIWCDGFERLPPAAATTSRAPEPVPWLRFPRAYVLAPRALPSHLGATL